MDSQVVVGVAIICNGQVLAARRTTPPELGGKWEFPGGKVQFGESASVAGAREILEELGVPVRIGNRLRAGPITIDNSFELEIYAAELTDGQPTATEHDSLRWLGPEELHSVDWLDPDRPFLTEIEQLLLDGSVLPGGNVGGAVRIGDTVRRPTGPWTTAVHALLTHLSDAGLPHIPAVLGRDKRDREILTYLPGHVIDVDDEVLTDIQLSSVVSWIRDFHDSVATFRPPSALQWRFVTAQLDAQQIICHNDVAPYNMAFDGEDLAGVFDWDVAGPGQRIDDLAFFAWNGVPLFRDVQPQAAAARLKLIASTYGGVDAIEILHAAVRRMSAASDRIEAGQAAGDPGMLNLGKVGEPARTRSRIEALAAVLPRIEWAITG